MLPEIKDKFPLYFFSQVPIEKFNGACSDLNYILKTTEYFISEIKRKKCEWNYEEAKIILYEMYNIGKAIKNLSSKNTFDDTLKSYNTVCVSSLVRVLIDAIINIIYLLDQPDSELLTLIKEVWFYKVDKGRLILVESGGKLSGRLFNLKKRTESKKEELLENKLLIKMKGGEEGLKKFLENRDERILKTKQILKNYNELYFNTMQIQLSQFVHFTPLGINMARKDNQNRAQLINHMSVIILYSCAILSEVIRLFNIKYKLPIEEKFIYLIKTYHHILTNKDILINSEFEDKLNNNEELLFLDAIKAYLKYSDRLTPINHNSMFFFFSDNRFELYNQKLTKKYYRLRNLEEGIYYLTIPQEKSEVLILFELFIEKGEVKKIKYIKSET